MRKPLILTLAFVISMVLGVVLLLLIITAIGFIQIASQQRNHSGIGAVAGGISEATVLLVPLLFGVIGVLITLRQIERRKS
jgi:uncharacterized membrane protein YsdA (DUF1294 family)